MADFDPQPVALVTPEGLPVDHPQFDVTLSSEELTELYEWMVVTRDVDAEFLNLQRQGQLALYPSCRGQEAAQVGCAAVLRREDWIFPQYRELGLFLMRGVPASAVGAVWRGTWHGGWGFSEHACAAMSIPIGTHALHAVGAAGRGSAGTFPRARGLRPFPVPHSATARTTRTPTVSCASPSASRRTWCAKPPRDWPGRGRPDPRTNPLT